MKIQIQQKELLKGINTVKRIAKNNKSMPATGYILFTTRGENIVEIAGADTDNQINCILNSVNEEKGNVSINTKQLYDIVKELPDEMITIARAELDRAHVSLGAFRATVDCYYPHLAQPVELPSREPVTIPCTILTKLIKQIIYAVDKYSLYPGNPKAGASLEIDKWGQVKLVSIDGHRLIVAENKIDSVPQDTLKGIIPHSALSELLKIVKRKGYVTLDIYEDNLYVCYENIILITNLIQAKFPPYEKVIPRECPVRSIHVNRPNFVGLLKRMLTGISKKEPRLVVLEIDEKLVVSTYNTNIHAEDEMGVTWVICEKGGKFTIGFNADYLLDVLTAIGTQIVAIDFQEELDPCVIHPIDPEDPNESFLAVVMPTRL